MLELNQSYSWGMTMSKTNTKTKISIPELVGKGYGQFWKFKGRYRVCKGSRASKKSKTTALWIIASMMAYPGSNTLVVRKVFRTLKDSCFTDLKWAVNRMGVSDWWEFKESPIEATYHGSNGEQKIFFRGLDDPLKIASIAVENGTLCWMWIEEAYEIMNESDFDMLDESIRGEAPDGLFKQITLTFNPWSDRHWIKSRFFDNPSSNNLAMTTNYKCNEWLDEADLALFEDMRIRNPRRYKVAGLGDWGIVEGLVYENWESDKHFTIEQLRSWHPDLDIFCGLDFGYTNDPSAFVVGFISKSARRIYIWDEFYKTGMSNREIAAKVTSMGYAKEKIKADSAEPKSIDELKGLGLRVKGARKGKDSINNGIQFIQDYEIIIHKRCVNFTTEISNYQWDKDKFGKLQNKPIDDFNHLQDATRYALEDYIDGGQVQIKTFKGGI